MKVIPAVFFQKQLDGVKEDVQIPERLALFESQLREVVRPFRIRLDGWMSCRLTTAANDPCQEFLIPAFWTSPEAGDDFHRRRAPWNHGLGS